MEAADALKTVLDLDLSKAGETHDLLRLLGVVLGQMALLEVITGNAEAKDKVAAARILVRLGEEPERIAERLRSSPLADLTVDQLREIVQKAKEGGGSLRSIIEEVRHKHTGVTNGTS